ncbi:MAG: SGNH/GDSL hydrolase family protein [Bacilli bacterium]
MSAIRKRNSLITLIIAVVIFGGIYGVREATVHQAQSAGPAAASKFAPPVNPERVMTIGGSIAKGWMDTGWQNWRKGWHGGYLSIAFASLSHSAQTHYTIYDRTIVGANARQLATMYAGRYPHWLKSVRPQIVVISWGGLNDALPKTPIGIYRKDILGEIRQALAVHAVVFIVTPPVTEDALTVYRVAVPYYLNNELNVARSMHNPNVYTFDVFNQMKAYLAAHHLSYRPFMANSWHPNARGHQLAGKILFQDISMRFGSQPVRFVR